MPLPSDASDQFRVLVDRSEARLPLPNLDAVTNHFFPASEALTTGSIGTGLYKIIADRLMLAANGGITPSEIRRLKRAIKYESVLGKPAQPYVRVAHVIHDAGDRSTPYRSFDKVNEWLDAIDAARGYIAFNEEFFDSDIRAEAVITAAFELQKAGVALSINDGRFDIDEGVVTRWCKEIEADIRSVGGWAVLGQVFAYLREGHSDFGRFMPGRRFGYTARSPSCPVNYLINLAVKHIDAAPVGDAAIASPIWKRIVERSRNICAVLDVEPYANTEDIILRAEEVPLYVATTALFDHLFTLRQWISSQTDIILEGVFDFIDPAKMKEMLGWTVRDAVGLAQFAFAKIGKFDLMTLNVDELADAAVSRPIWRQMRPHFIHDAGSVNREYLTPRDANKADWANKPFLQMPNNQCIGFVSASVLAPTFFEAVSGALRGKRYPNLDGDMGLAMERLLSRELKKHGLRVSVDEHGKYKMFDPIEGKTVDGECDVVVETDDTILLFELKKKPLTRLASTGDELAGLVDLAASLMAAQSQLVRHERILRHNKCIMFEDGYRLDHNGRNVERIAVTLLDFGGFQDKYLLGQLLAVLMGRNLAAHGATATQEKALKKLNDSIQDLTTQMALPPGVPIEPISVFKNCWFLSIPQILMLLDGVESPDMLTKRMATMGRLTFRTLDFYLDYSLARSQKLVQ